MGCDIHLFVEYKQYDNWYPFGYAELRLNRNYKMFGMMAGVRRNTELSFDPRGLPSDVSTVVDGENKLYVSDDSEKYTSVESAKRYEKMGCEITYRDGKPVWVEHPDWHSHSWLKREEYDKILDKYKGEELHPLSPDYISLKHIMYAYEANGSETRLVFWFDN